MIAKNPTMRAARIGCLRFAGAAAPQSDVHRMRYPEFRRQHLFVGTGVIEAGCKTVISSAASSGHVLDVRGANAIMALRCCQFNGRFEDYWEARRA
jgi:hypothetical protein